MTQDSDSGASPNGSLAQIERILAELSQLISFLRDAETDPGQKESEEYRAKETRFSQLIRELFAEILTSKFEQARRGLLEIGPYLKNKGQDIFDTAYRSFNSIFQSVQQHFSPSAEEQEEEMDAGAVRGAFEALVKTGMNREEAHEKVWKVVALVKAGLPLNDAVRIILSEKRT